MKPSISFFLLAAAVMFQPADGLLPELPPVEAQPKSEEAPPVPLPTMGLIVPCKVLEVHDGDTVTVEFRCTMNIRLIDCWAPELTRQAVDKNGEVILNKKTGNPVTEANPDGLRSKTSLLKMAKDRQGILTIPWNQDIGKMTTMGRILGKLEINGTDMSYEQVRLGRATKTKKGD